MKNDREIQLLKQSNLNINKIKCLLFDKTGIPLALVLDMSLWYEHLIRYLKAHIQCSFVE